MRWIVAFAFVALVAPAAAVADAPSVVTGPPTSVAKTAVKATGTVNPRGVETTVRAEFGETEALGSFTTAVPVGAGTDPRAVKIRIEGLKAGTAYRYRFIAASADGTTVGAVQRVRTAPGTGTARPPVAATKPAKDIQPTTATLTATVNPGGLPTRYAFEYGTTEALGSRTPEVSAGSADGVVAVERVLTSLQPATRYYTRVVATNSAGTVVGATRSFATPRGLTSILLTLPAPVITWGGTTSLRGKVLGASVSAIPIALQRQDYPFSTPFREVGKGKTGADGSFLLAVRRVRSPARLRVVTRTTTPTTSPVATLGTKLKVVAGVTLLGRRRAAITATIRPGIGRGRVIAQRQDARRRWVTIGARPRVRRINRTRVRVRLKLARRSTAMRIRLVAVHSDTRRYQRAESRSLRVPAAGRR